MAIDFRDSYNIVTWDLNRWQLNKYCNGSVDDNGNGYKIMILQDGNVLTPTTEEVYLYFQKPDNTKGYIKAEPVNEYFVVDLTNQVYAMKGNVSCNFQITSNSKWRTSPEFIIIVDDNNIKDSIESSDDFIAFQNALNSLGDITTEVNTAVINANTAINNINNEISEINILETDISNSEANRVIAENTRVSNENDRIQAELLRPDFVTKTQDEYDALTQTEKDDPLIFYKIIDDDGELPTELQTLIDNAITATNAANQAATGQLPDVGTVGTYNKVTTDAKGRVINGTLESTLSGIGVTDAYTKTDIDTKTGDILDLETTATNLVGAINEVNANSGGSITFDSVSLMKADNSLKTGDYVTTTGYYSVNDGGGANYIIVASGTGTDDGGSYITLDNTLQAKMIIDNETVSVKQFGAKGDGTTDDITTFNNAMNIGRTVFIPESTYNFSTALTITSTHKVNKLIGVGDAKSALKFVGTDGIIANKSGVTIENLFWYGNSTGKGLKVLNSVNVKGCEIYTFGGGIALNNEVHVITSNFERVTISLCPEYGIHLKSGGNYQNNGITFKELYIVKCGTDVNNLTSDATIGTGDGFIIDGGYSITVENCIFEYNTGIGLKLMSNNYPLYGVSIINPYFERNKYANLYINKGTYDITNTVVVGDFYTEAGNTPVSNALAERKLYVSNQNAWLNGTYGNRFGLYGDIERNMNVRKNNFMNAFPINFMDDMESTYPNNIVTYDSQKCFKITYSITGAMLYSELANIDPYYDYAISYDIKKVNTSASPNLLFGIYDADTNSYLTGVTGNLSVTSSFDWRTFSSTLVGLSTSTKRLRIYINIEGTKPADCEVYIRNIRITPIIKHNGNTVLNTYGNLTGDSRFSTTLGKPVYWNGTTWTDSTSRAIWQASTAFTLNTIVNTNINQYQCTTAGTTSTTMPTHTTGTASDGSIIWTFVKTIA